METLKARFLMGVMVLVAVLFTANAAFASHVTEKGFDEFGYNYNARIFAGEADGVDRNLDGTVWGDSAYADDRLVMKWSEAWDEARFHGAEWTPDAWVTNEWNGMKDGSKTTWHYKIIWVGADLEDSAYWVEGGYPIWGEFEVIMDQGVDKQNDFCGANNGGHQICALATPNGLG